MSEHKNTRRRAVTWCVSAAISVVAVLAPIASAASTAESSCAHAAAWKRLAAKGIAPIARRVLEVTGDTDVLHYSLDIEAKIPTQEIAGTCVMTVQSRIAGLTEFTFRLSDAYAISQLLVNGQPVGFTRLDAATVRANLGQSFGVGQNFVLTVGYAGVAPQSLGFGSIVFRTRTSGASEVFTLSEPWYAYTWWPAKDVSEDKATVDVAVTIPNTMTVASNGLLQGIDPVAGSKLKFRWSHSYPIAPYLVSFAATNFNTWTQTFNFSGGSMPVSFFIYPESDTSANRTAWGQSVQMLQTFGTKYGPYPFLDEKYGIYQFGYGGGMEHQTITGQGTFSESVTAHELAHQWWGDMVTCETWHDIWLNEGFATYGEALWLENKPGSTGLAALKAAMQARKPSNVNGTVYRYDISTVSSIFSTSFSYRKGGWVLHMLRHVVGDPTFFAILEEYRSRFEYLTAVTDDFMQVAEDVAGKDLNWFFDPWLFQPGALAYQWGNQSVIVNGGRYLLVHLRQTQSASYPVFRMPVDLRFTVNSAPVTTVLWNNAALQHYVIPVAAAPSSPTLDPDGWVLTTSVASQAYVPGPPKIVQVSPSPGPAQDSDLSTIRITFHTPVNAQASDFEVRTDIGEPIQFTMLYDAGINTATLTMASDVSFAGLVVKVKDTVTAVNSGMRLDGEMPAGTEMPSGDGLPGGEALIRFSF